MTPFLQLFTSGAIFALVQLLAALPWLAALNLNTLRSQIKQPVPGRWLLWAAYGIGGVLVVGLLFAWLMQAYQVKETLEYYGQWYGNVLQVQLSADFFVLVFGLLMLFWPKGGAVALSAFRESWRQPMYWLIAVLALAFLFITPWIPYFTFGENFKMAKDISYDIIMLATIIFAVLAASMSISEEIEGRTAITLMSKPVSRREFLIGKFIGILLASAMMIAILSLLFDNTMLIKMERDSIPVPRGTERFAGILAPRLGDLPGYFARGGVYWLCHVFDLFPGILFGFCQVMVLLSIAVALATRLPMVVNLMICFVIFLAGRLTPVLEQVAAGKLELVKFTAQLFDTLLPAFDLFNLGPVIVRDTPPQPGPYLTYLALVAGYAVLYTTISLLFGLILFEDRDLA
jgi:ABC-type transport system involved in multi-copper enzyme maturation permease subunit